MMSSLYESEWYSDWGYKYTLDDNGNRLLTNFDDDDWLIYEIAIEKYPHSKKRGLFLRTAKENPAYDRCSIWCYPYLGDLSEFWRIHEDIKQNLPKYIRKKNRERKLERIFK